MNVVVVGAGAAGFFAAIHAAEQGSDVTILEKTDKLLTKVKISGGGRCNVTNGCDDVDLFVRNYPRGFKELKGPFSRFNRLQTIDWFKGRGVALKTESDGRMFPVTNSSQTIIDTLLSAASEFNVTILKNHKVTGIQKVESGFKIICNDEQFYADKIIVATGGHPSAEFYKWITQTGHEVTEPVPSLFTFNTPDSNFKDLKGISIEDVRIKVIGSKYEEEGPLLFTHWGLSGPAVLKLSAWAARYLHELDYHFDIAVNFLPGKHINDLKDQFNNFRKKSSGIKVFNTKGFGIPNRLWLKICSLSGVGEQLMWSDCSNDHILRLIENLLGCNFSVKGKTTFKEEFVTCGGVCLKQVNMKTMESKIVPGLFFAGEVLDIDGVTGGFNFQAAWTTGYIAGVSVNA